MNFQYTTILNNGFEYFVHVDEKDLHDDRPHCTLVQVSDRSVLSRYFHNPPRDDADKAFFKNLKYYKNVNVKNSVCTKHVELALAHIQNEIKVLSNVVVPSENKQFKKLDPSKQAVIVEPEVKSKSKSESESKSKSKSISSKIRNVIDDIDLLPYFSKTPEPEVGDEFKSMIDCDMTPRKFELIGYRGVSIPASCLKHTNYEGKNVNGKITAKKNNNITFTLKNENNENVYSNGWNVSNDFTIPYDANYTIWKNYNTSTMRSFQLREAGGGGNCFFFSLFFALSEKKLLDTLNIDVLTKDKDQFNTTFRAFLAAELKQTLTDFVTNYYSSIPKENVSLIKKGLSQEFQKILNDRKNESVEDTVKQLQDAIKKPGTYVSEIEVKKTIEILKNYGVTLVILNDPNSNNSIVNLDPKKYTINDKTIILANIKEGHYQWLDPVKSSSGGTRRRLPRKPRHSQRRQRRQTKFDTAQ